MFGCLQLVVRLGLPLLVLLLGAVQGAASVQTIQGRVVDVATDAPVASAVVELLRVNADDDVDARAVTDEEGYFGLRAPGPGSYRLRSLRLGYEPVITRPFAVTLAGEPLEVELRISAAAVQLDPLTIVSEPSSLRPSQRLANAGYYDRLERYGPEGLGAGQFLDQKRIKSTSPSQVSDLLRTLPGVQVSGGGGRRQIVTMRSRGALGGRCVPQVYVDGAPAATGANVDELLSPWSLAAVEVYTGGNVPARFWRYARHGSGASGACGVVVLWTGYGGADAESSQSSGLTSQPPPADLVVLLALSADSVTLPNTVMAVVTVENLADESRSLCVTEARYALKSASTSWDVREAATRHECLEILELPAGGTVGWRELVPVDAHKGVGLILIQRVIGLRPADCNMESCATELRSAPHHLFIHRN